MCSSPTPVESESEQECEIKNILCAWTFSTVSVWRAKHWFEALITTWLFRINLMIDVSVYSLKWNHLFGAINRMGKTIIHNGTYISVRHLLKLLVFTSTCLLVKQRGLNMRCSQANPKNHTCDMKLIYSETFMEISWIL